MKDLSNSWANKEATIMTIRNKPSRLLTILAAVAIFLSFCGPALAVDDGARAYWKGRAGTHVVSFQYLRLDMDASGSQQFAPGQYIYPNSDTSANIVLAAYARHFTMPMLKRPSSLSVAVVGGGISLDVNTDVLPPQFLPPGLASGSQSSSGFGDPSVQLDVNLFGTPPLISTVDLVNYEPTWTLDAAVMLAFPIGEYDSDKLVNIGQNRWYGRIALPFKYHFRVFDPGRMSSFELTPSVWLFAENGDFMGETLKNDPLWQIEAHLTHDFTRSFFGSLDLLYRGGFQSEIDGVEVGDELDVGDLGFTLNYQITDNFTMRASYAYNLFGDSNLDNSLIRIQCVYAWHRLIENKKKLQDGH
jgi:hypothetical protein